jgi:hypothetical protein
VGLDVLTWDSTVRKIFVMMSLMSSHSCPIMHVRTVVPIAPYPFERDGHHVPP